MGTIVKVMQLPDSGLEIRDRMWLKITIANAVIGGRSAVISYSHYAILFGWTSTLRSTDQFMTLHKHIVYTGIMNC